VSFDRIYKDVRPCRSSISLSALNVIVFVTGIERGIGPKYIIIIVIIYYYYYQPYRLLAALGVTLQLKRSSCFFFKMRICKMWMRNESFNRPVYKSPDTLL